MFALLNALLPFLLLLLLDLPYFPHNGRFVAFARLPFYIVLKGSVYLFGVLPLEENYVRRRAFVGNFLHGIVDSESFRGLLKRPDVLVGNLDILEL